MAEEFMYLVNSTTLSLRLVASAAGASKRKTGTRGNKNKDKGQLASLIAKHVGGIANEDVALAKALSAFVTDEDRRLRG